MKIVFVVQSTDTTSEDTVALVQGIVRSQGEGLKLEEFFEVSDDALVSHPNDIRLEIQTLLNALKPLERIATKAGSIGFTLDLIEGHLEKLVNGGEDVKVDGAL